MSLKKIFWMMFAAGSQAMASPPGVDSPELAKPGPYAAGYRELRLVHANQPDLRQGAAAHDARRYDRALQIDLWYPAAASKRATPVRYQTSLWGEPPEPSKTFSHTGLAFRNAAKAGSRHPLIILSHGYSNSPALMSWLTENLASKGYVVAGIRHADPNPYIAAPNVRVTPFYTRPADISFVASQLRATLGDEIDPEKIALIGYSQGGYGVLTAGGASLDPAHPLIKLENGWAMSDLARGGALASSIKVPGVKAIVSLAPTGGGHPHIWGSGISEITAPLMLIAGEVDPVVGYENAARAFFEQTTKSDRYLLTYKQAGHQIALIPAPAEMRGSTWDMSWFEDPIWRQDRIGAINLHFITAFLDLHLRGDTQKRAYLDVPVPDSESGTWDAPPGTPWGAYSPGGPGITLWKGFQRRSAQGLKLEHRRPD